LLLFAFVVVVSFMPTAPASFFFHPTQVSFFIASFIFLLNLWESNVFFFWIPDFPEGRLWQFYLIRWRKLLFFVTCLYIIVILNIIYFLYIIFLSPLSVLLSPIRFYFFVFLFMFFLVFFIFYLFLFLFFIFSYLYLFCFFIF
jgi:hypothetical protein